MTPKIILQAKTLFLSLLFFISLQNISAQVGWVNEIHYDNNGSDSNENIEIAVLTSSISDYNLLNLHLINGADNQIYASVDIGVNYSSISTNGAYTILTWEKSGIQNGSPDGVLLTYNDILLDFISYEGSLNNISVAGFTDISSTDIGVEESNTTPSNYSLQRTGIGTDATWTTPSAASLGTENSAVGQNLNATPRIQEYSPNETAIYYQAETEITLTFYNEVTLTDGWFELLGSSQGTILCEASTSDQKSFTLSPQESFDYGQSITVNLYANKIANADNPTQFMDEDISFSFDITPKVLINEILADPHNSLSFGDSNIDGIRDAYDDEFIEFVNPTPIDLDISNWTVTDAELERHVFEDGTTLKAGEAIIVFGGGNPNANFGCAQYVISSNGFLGLNNTGDIISIKDENGNLIDQVTYGSDANSDQSITRQRDALGKTFSTHLSISEDYFSPGVQTDLTPFADNNCPSISFTADTFEVTESNSELFETNNIVKVKRDGDLSGALTIEIHDLESGDATGGNNPDLGIDYDNSEFPIEIIFSNGEGGEKAINIPIHGDTELESNETIHLSIQIKEAETLPYISPVETVSLSIIDDENITLPIQLISFKGEIENYNLSLNWATVSEVNIKSFDIETSENGINWMSIDRVNANGFEAAIQKYQWRKNVFPSNPKYARLKIKESDHQYSYTDILPLTNTQKANILVYPSQIESGQLIHIQSPSVALQETEIYNLFGQLIYYRKFTENIFKIHLDIPLQNGFYLIHTIDQLGKRHIQKIIVE
ncbi:lamin tail domain-containing protein [Sediminitomix flava]|uniref:Putative secreted protein (Por secretion system target) n=1 Tax=Sediminitomix flava TaxID=379075 RepID=A0A315ZGG2_SEDFL|nr:lamin tail domain-containing protein [Sediminitomix flava]PWJ44422.1 putative secreted protein (Por secretion system target) [Sediminitomix flava]